jgi:hypothetical protein
MEFSWTIAVAVLLVNWFVMGLMFMLQQCDRNMPERHSIIPGTRQKFLYFQDFWTMTWGDAVGVGLIQIAFGIWPIARLTPCCGPDMAWRYLPSWSSLPGCACLTTISPTWAFRKSVKSALLASCTCSTMV